MTDLTDRFAICLHATLAWEGGWDDDPIDPGGATCQGVTIGEFAAWHHQKLDTQSAPALKEALRALDDETRDSIYRVNYWQACRCAELPPGVDLCVFDQAVNQGVSKAIKTLQQAVGETADGHLGVKTFAAVHAASPIAIIQKMMEERRRYYRSLKTFWRFGRGWLNRCAAIEKQCVDTVHGGNAMGMALGLASVANDAATAPKSTPKAVPDAPAQTPAASSTVWAAGAGILAGMVSMVQAMSAMMGALVQAGKSAGDLHLAAGSAPLEFAIVLSAVVGLLSCVYVMRERIRKMVQG